ncbi:glycerol-3-phosphate dehydrogenase [Vibrio coralliilyticus]|uniref:glycerol-3-phosphate dehydrogenase n=1 Tax=Vibrio coralliilyticus TaxID=190893 RepID=UPI00148CEDFE|nr:glycerol-3-phosphate dehydrogenase [Vibrio coralliilyticus]NOI29693.1 glycerol-3-phosphate dehydrogenase [Vibrio coralliilyticus]NOI48649.1 glycerol-3-phosphate dehydrogenase [Vibrio coralliilyticus]
MTVSYLKEQKEQELLDLIVVGGGINGAGIAVDAAGRGLKVGLYEAQDFAGATSSASSKLIHGGLRYLEHYEFRLVGEALAEREVLLAKAPHIAFPMRFRLPHRPFLRPAWMIRAGLFLYDHLGKRTSLPSSKKIKLDNENVTLPELNVGFEYSDCWVDDARLVVLNVIQAQELGAEVSNYCKVTKAQRIEGIWHVELYDQRTCKTFFRKAKALVNATGPWVKEFLTENTKLPSPYGIRLIKGSHIIVPKIHDEEQAYIMQNEDNRIVFVIPYLGKFSMIGTTDVEYKGDPRKVAISEEEKQYLIDVTNQHFRKQITIDDVVADFSGVRPLCDDESDSPQAITRDYTLSLDHKDGEAPLLSIFGGKLTTYRKLSESAMQHLSPYFNLKESWTKNAPLPGGEDFTWEKMEAQLAKQVPFIDNETRLRWLRAYGSRVEQLLEGVSTEQDLGIKFSAGIYQKEIDYLVKRELGTNAEDVLKRRSKLHLLCDQECYQAIESYLDGTEYSIHEQCA